MISEIVEQSANPACLEAKLRSLGEKHLTVEMTKAFYSNMTWVPPIGKVGYLEHIGKHVYWKERPLFCRFCLRLFDIFHNTAQVGPTVLIFPWSFI